MGQKYFVNRILFSHVLNEMLFYTSISWHVYNYERRFRILFYADIFLIIYTKLYHVHGEKISSMIINISECLIANAWVFLIVLYHMCMSVILRSVGLFQYVLSCGKDSLVKLWELSTNRCLIVYTGAGMTGKMQHGAQAVFNHTEDYSQYTLVNSGQRDMTCSWC